MSKVVNIEVFKEKLPGVIAGYDKLTALFTSYNSVGCISDGKYNSGIPELEILVQNGTRIDDPATLGFMLGAMQLASDHQLAFDLLNGAIANEVQEAKNSQARLEADICEKIKQAVASDVNMLLVIYGGLFGFDEVSRYAEKIKKSPLGGKIRIIMDVCDCDMSKKKPLLNRLAEEGIIECGVYTPECGGRGAMRDLLMRLVEEWKESH